MARIPHTTDEWAACAVNTLIPLGIFVLMVIAMTLAYVRALDHQWDTHDAARPAYVEADQ